MTIITAITYLDFQNFAGSRELLKVVMNKPLILLTRACFDGFHPQSGKKELQRSRIVLTVLLTVRGSLVHASHWKTSLLHVISSHTDPCWLLDENPSHSEILLTLCKSGGQHETGLTLLLLLHHSLGYKLLCCHIP